MDLIDQVLANTTGRGPTILSEEHDLSKINWVAGLFDPGEMIRCGYLPEIRRRAGEQDKEYADRIRPIVMALPKKDRDLIMGAAIRRASLDTSNGKVAVMVAGQAPWHGLGVNVAEAVSSEHAIKLASLDWKVKKVPLMYDIEGNLREAPGVFGIVRDDTGAMLGSVGSRYEPIQNESGFDFLDSLLQEFGAKYESAGAIYGGCRVWMMARLPEQSFAVTSEDRTEMFALFVTSHDGSSAARLFPTSERVCCSNTLRISVNKGRGQGLSLRHTGSIKGRVEEAKRAMGIAVRGAEEFKEQMDVLVRTPLDEPEEYFHNVLDAVLDITEAEAMKGADALAAAIKVSEAERELARKVYEKRIERRESVLEEILTRYESERCGIGGVRGTAYGSFQAITEEADHGQVFKYKGKDKTSRRFESLLEGPADSMKQVGLTQALALAN